MFCVFDYHINFFFSLIHNLLMRWQIGILSKSYSTNIEKLPLRTTKRKTELIKVN